MEKFDLSQLEVLAEGKTKTVFQHPTVPNFRILHFKDDITAGDGAQKDIMQGKGLINCETSSLIMRYLERYGVSTHFVDYCEDQQVVKQVNMVPLECISRQIAYGSLIKRFPFFEKGQKLDQITFETDFKNDAQNDPSITKQMAILGGIVTDTQYEVMKKLTIKAFEVLEKAFAKLDATLVDYKIEFGITPDGKVLLADELTNDSWRVWPGGIEEHMLDKEVYRQTADVKKAKVGYEQMLELVRKF